MNVVTGGAGLVGQEIILQLLAKDEKVKAIYNSSPINISHPLLTTLHCDILDIETLAEIVEGASYVYHTAAIVSYSPHDRDKMYKINVEGTANIANVCNDLQIKKLIYISSVAAIAKTETEATEKMYWDADTKGTHYAQSKYLAEMQVWRAAAEGLQMVIVNPSIILGCSNWETGSSRIFKNIWNKFPYYSIGKAGFVDVSDVAKISIMLAQSNITDERFILNENSYSYQKIFELIATQFKVRIPYKKVTPFLAALSWRYEKLKFLFTGKPPLITKETAQASFTNSFYSNSKILKQFPDYEFFSIEKSIEKNCKLYIEKYKLS